MECTVWEEPHLCGDSLDACEVIAVGGIIEGISPVAMPSFWSYVPTGT